MLTYLVAFALAFGVSAGLTPLLRVLAPMIGGIDRAESRKVHVGAIPRIGGVAIVIAFFVPLVGLFIYQTDVGHLFRKDSGLVVALFSGGIAIAALGFYDDLHGAGAKLKFTVQICVALLVYKLGFHIERIASPFDSVPFSLVDMHVPWTTLQIDLSLPVTVLWIVGIINAMNLIDGLDGLAGGVALISIGLIFVIAFQRPSVLMCLFTASLGGAVMGFLLYNFNPATIFMGDTGSMFLGFVIGTSAMVSSSKGTTVVAMIVPVVCLGLPIADTALAVIRRWLRGRPLFSADKEHIHHRLLAMGLTHRQAVLTLYVICLFFAAAALGLAYATSGQAEIIAGALGVFVTLLFRWLGYLKLDPEIARRNSVSRERNSELRTVVRKIGQELEEAMHIDGIWNALKQLGPVLHAGEMTFSVLLRDDGGEQVRSILSWRPQHSGTRTGSCLARLEIEARPLPGQPLREAATLVVSWTDGRREVDRDDELALERLRAHLESAFARLETIAAESSDLVPAGNLGQVVEFRRRNDG